MKLDLEMSLSSLGLCLSFFYQVFFFPSRYVVAFKNEKGVHLNGIEYLRAPVTHHRFC